LAACCTSRCQVCLACLACPCLACPACRLRLRRCKDMAWHRVKVSGDLCTRCRRLLPTARSLCCTAERCSGTSGILVGLRVRAFPRPTAHAREQCCHAAAWAIMHVNQQRRQSISLAGVRSPQTCSAAVDVWPVVARRTETGPLHQGRADREGLTLAHAGHATDSTTTPIAVVGAAAAATRCQMTCCCHCRALPCRALPCPPAVIVVVIAMPMMVMAVVVMLAPSRPPRRAWAAMHSSGFSP
jgi:hypothetical protein